MNTKNMKYFPNLENMLFRDFLMEEERIQDLAEPDWKIIKINDIQSKYSVSNFGDVINLETSNILTPRVTKCGYLIYNLKINSIRYYKKAHRLVAEAFIPNPENKPEVNHINTDKLDNYYKNLEWVTSSENKLHAYKMGLYENARRPGIERSKNIKDESIIHEICNLLENNYTVIEVAKELNISEILPRSIKYGGKWKYISSLYNIPSPVKRKLHIYNEKKNIIDNLIINKNMSVDEILKLLNIEKNKNSINYIRGRKFYLNGKRSTTIEPV